MSFLLLGRVAACDHRARPVTIQGNKARALLALLLVRANRHVPTDLLEDELWDGAPPRGARSTVQAHVSRLRTVLAATAGGATLNGGAGGYELCVDPTAIDTHRFEALATHASRVVAHDPRQAADLCARALDEWRGPALQDVRHLPTLYVEAERLDELRLATIEARFAAELETGGHAMVIGSLRRLVDEHPYRERLRALLMVALYRSGRQAEALRAYQAGYAALAEIGLRPGRELRALEESIGREDPTLQTPARSAVSCAAVSGAASAAVESVDVPRRDHGVVLVEGPDAAKAVDALVESAGRAGRVVLRGRAHPTPTRPYQSIADALAPLLTAAVDPVLSDRLAPIVGAVAPPTGVDPAFQRFQAFEGVLEVLDAQAARAPLLLVLEDVDRAGASTLDLLEHLARRRTHAALTVVASRPTTSSGRAVDAWLVRLDRDGLVHRASAGSVDHTSPAVPENDDQSGPPDHAGLAADAFAHAATLSARAGDDAQLRLGFEEAATHYRAALTALDLTPGPQILRRAELHIALGRACHAAYQLDDALAGFRRAAAYAAELGDLHLLADAAVGVATATEYGMADSEIVAVLSAALHAVPDESPVRVELLAGLGRTLPGRDPAAIDHVRNAVGLARQLDAPRPLAIALATAVLVTWGPDRTTSRLADIDEVIARAEDLAMVELAIEARGWRAATLRQLGREAEAQVDTAIVRKWADQSRRPYFLALDSMLSIAEHLRHGWTDAADAALADLPSGADTSPNFSAGFAAQLFLLRRQQGRVHEFLPLFDMLAGDQRGPAAWNAARVLTLAETGDCSAFDALDDAVAALPDVPADWLWLATVALLADACIHLGAPNAAVDLYRRLLPHRHESVIVAHGVASLGPVRPRLEALRGVARTAVELAGPT